MNGNNLQFNTDKFLSRMFRKVDNVVWDLMTGAAGVQTKGGIITITGLEEGEMPQISVNLFDNFGVPVPAFATSTSNGDVKVGDLIHGEKGVLGWVIETHEKSMQIMAPDGHISRWMPPKVQGFGLSGGVMVVKSLVNLMPNGDLGGMQGLLLPLMAFSQGNADLEKMVPLILMTQTGMFGAQPNGTNPMGAMGPALMMAALMGKGNPFG